jgi:hypothetical protein
MSTDTKAKITGVVSTVGAAAAGAAAGGWKAAVIAGAGALFSWLGGLFHTKPGA